MGDTVDPDTKVLAADPDETTLLACYLNEAMERDAAARDAYLATYGVDWSPLGLGISIRSPRITESTTAKTNR